MPRTSEVQNQEIKENKYYSEIEDDQLNDAKNIGKILAQIDSSISKKIKCNNAMLIELADSMAENATAFTGQGYGSFLQSRQKFIDTLAKINEEYEELLSILHRNKV